MWGGGGGGGVPPQLQALAMIYSIVAAVCIYDAAAARREQRSSLAITYRQVRSGGGGGSDKEGMARESARRNIYRHKHCLPSSCSFILPSPISHLKGKLFRLFPPCSLSHMTWHRAQEKCRRSLRKSRRAQANGSSEAEGSATASQIQGGGTVPVAYVRNRSRSTCED